MSFTVILSARDHHNVRTVEEFRQRHAALITRKRRAGQRLTVVEDPQPRAARIDYGTWLIDCDCGAGNATDPEWGIALCFGCGTVHTQVVFPDQETRVAIELLVLARPKMANRFWFPGESVDTLRRVNEDVGLVAALPEGHV